MADPTRPIDSEQPSPDVEPEAAKDPAEELERLRKLLLGKEQQDLNELRERFDTWELTPEEMAEQLPEAIGLRTSRDGSLGRALAPTLETGIAESVQRNPRQIAEAIYPILGPAIRRAISDALSRFVDALNRAFEHSLSVRGLKWRLEALRTGVPYTEIVLKHALLYRVEQVFLIQSESGLLLGHVALEDSESKAPDLISGMLTAIRDFVTDSFEAAEAGGLRRFKVGELTVMVEAGPRATIAVVVRGQEPPELLGRMQAVLETIHLQFRSQLADFDGDTEALEPAEPILAELLETVVATDRPQSRSMAPRVAWALVGVGLVLLLVLGIRARLAWSEAVEAIRAEPGLTLIDADRGFRRWSFEGLRDPLARDPLEVLVGIGADTEGVEGRWEPYLSFDPEMVLMRSERALDPPTGVGLSLDEGTLRARGTASARWALLARARARGLAGVSELNLSDLEITVPPDVASLRAEIEAQRVMFSVGSARLTAESLAMLDQLAPRLQQLRTEADVVRYRVHLRLIGRTDSSGTEEANRTLSEERANSVLVALVERGLEPDAVSVEGIGVADPLTTSDDTAGEQLNRSVSFAITLSGWEKAVRGDS